MADSGRLDHLCDTAIRVLKGDTFWLQHLPAYTRRYVAHVNGDDYD